MRIETKRPSHGFDGLNWASFADPQATRHPTALPL
jgi:hypothetical protein